jgi:hypothetical protein
VPVLAYFALNFPIVVGKLSYVDMIVVVVIVVVESVNVGKWYLC